jgi:hypothetical protein
MVNNRVMDRKSAGPWQLAQSPQIFVSTGEGTRLRLGGLCGRVVKEEVVMVGDKLVKLGSR